MNWSACRRLRNVVNNKVRSAKANYNRNLILENINDLKSFWRAVNKVVPNDPKSNQSVTSIKFGDLKTDKGSIAEGFNLFFTSVRKAIGDKISQRSDAAYQQQWPSC